MNYGIKVTCKEAKVISIYFSFYFRFIFKTVTTNFKMVIARIYLFELVKHKWIFVTNLTPYKRECMESPGFNQIKLCRNYNFTV